MAKKSKAAGAGKAKGPMIYGGVLTRTLEFRPGVLDNLVTVSRRYTLATFNKMIPDLEGSVGRTNGETVRDDTGKEWGSGELMRIGSDGRQEGAAVLMVHKFVPISTMYPPDSMPFLNSGTPL